MNGDDNDNEYDLNPNVMADAEKAIERYNSASVDELRAAYQGWESWKLLACYRVGLIAATREHTDAVWKRVVLMYEEILRRMEGYEKNG